MSRVRGRGSGLGGVLEACALIVTALVLCAVVGVANPLPRPIVDTDILGPDNGESVAGYIERADLSLSGDGSTPSSDPRWALVSFPVAVSPQQAFDAASSARIAQVLLRVPIERVQTPVITVGVPGSEQSVLDAEDAAATQLHGSTGQWDRQSQIDGVSETALAAGCSCVVGLIVRAPLNTLGAVRLRSDVRSVEALPPDAVAGRFAVRALLPEYVDVIGPLPDDGELPPR